MVQILSPTVPYKSKIRAVKNSSAKVILCREDLKHPPTAVGGIEDLVQVAHCREDLKHPPTAVGGIWTFVQSPNASCSVVPPATKVSH